MIFWVIVLCREAKADYEQNIKLFFNMLLLL